LACDGSAFVRAAARDRFASDLRSSFRL